MFRQAASMSRWAVRMLAVSVASFAIAGCQREAAVTADTAPVATRSDELSWAQKALGRNPQIELVATDAQAQVFTVRNKTTGAVMAVRLDELAAAPVAQLTAASMPSPAATNAPAAMEPPAATPAAAPSAPPPTVAANTGDIDPAESGGEGSYTIERTDGQVRVSGPGVSIVSAGGKAASNDASDASQRTTDPIICQGRRMLHLDNRNIYVEGNAITASDGCEVHITNSRIVASGTGVVVHGATVHVSNSHIEGAQNSFEADSRAKLFIRASTFQGLPRRDHLAMVQDQGGNRWR